MLYKVVLSTIVTFGFLFGLLFFLVKLDAKQGVYSQPRPRAMSAKKDLVPLVTTDVSADSLPFTPASVAEDAFREANVNDSLLLILKEQHFELKQKIEESQIAAKKIKKALAQSKLVADSIANNNYLTSKNTTKWSKYFLKSRYVYYSHLEFLAKLQLSLNTDSLSRPRQIPY